MPLSVIKLHATGPDEYNFTTDNFIEHIPSWTRLLFFSPQRPCRILEIGSHQGMSAIWLIENKLKGGDELHIVDSWENEAELDGTSKHEALFDRNIKLALKKNPDITVHKHKARSKSLLPQMLAQGMCNTFDFIYIDGCHDAANVLEDLILSNLLCKVGGIILCDDYLWNYALSPCKTPKLAVDAFTNCFREKIEIIKDVPLFQIWLRKIRN